MSGQRYVLMIFLCIAALTGLTIQAASVSAFAQFAIPDARLLQVVTTSSALAVVGGAVTFLALVRNVRAVSYTGEVVAELAQVHWPTREESVRAATTVVLTAMFAAMVIATYDFIWKNLADLVLFTEG